MSEPQPELVHPDVHVKLTGTDGNVFSVIGKVAAAIKAAVGEDAAAAYKQAALMCGSYDEVLGLTMRTVDVH